MKNLKETLKRQIEQLQIENLFHRNINQYLKSLSNKEMVRHIEEVGKYTQKIEETLFELLGFTIKLPIELIEIDEETKVKNATMPKDEAYKMARFKTKKISRLFKENNY